MKETIDPEHIENISKVLIVDDDESNLYAIEQVIKPISGVDVVKARSGREVLGLSLREELSMILMDIKMPDLNGFEVAKLLKSNLETKKIPILFLTGTSFELDNIIDGYNIGAIDYIRKPINPIILRSKVNIFLEIFNTNKKLERLVVETAKLANNDVLTNVYNRRQFNMLLETNIYQSHRKHGHLALILLDLDDFKAINDNNGHDVGDEVLREVANRIKAISRNSDIIARLGGDEFAILIPDFEKPSDIWGYADKIKLAMSKKFVIKGCHLQISTSIGICCFPENADSLEKLMKGADLALYKAKEHKGDFRFFDQQLDSDYQLHIQTEDRLKKAWHRGDFELYFQPIVDIANKTIKHCEALLRLKSDSNEYESMGSLIPKLENNGMIIPLGQWILHRSCLAQVKWKQETGQDICVSVNMSLKQFSSHSLLSELKKVLIVSGISPQKLIIEITESHMLQDAKLIMETFKAIKDMGINIAIDDYGTGYSSLSYLRKFPFNILKIDQSFVKNLDQSKNNRIIVDSTIKLSHDLGLQITAEGVESQSELDILKGMGCDYIQGFYLYKPCSSDAILEILSDKKIMRLK